MTTNDTRRRRLGTIVDVSAERFRVEIAETSDSYTLVGFDGQHYIARIGSLVLIPLSNAYVVAEVTELQERPSQSDTSSSSRSLADISNASSRMLYLAPLGTLPFDESKGFTFGVSVYPPLYADVLHVENRDLDRILNVANQEVFIPDASPKGTRYNTLTVGTSVIFNDYDVKIRVNEFFGAHSAILGNTGSGKSCTISSFLQAALGKTNAAPAGGCTFVILDTNGEYRRAVSELPDPIQRTFARIEHRHASILEPAAAYDNRENLKNFHLPHWLLNFEEWELLLQASSLVQRPILRNALGLTSLFASDFRQNLDQLQDHILASCLLFLLMDSENPTAAEHRIKSLLNFHPLKSIPSTDITSLLVIEFGKFKEPGRKQATQKLKDLLLSDAEIPPYQNRPFNFSELKTAIEIAILYEESHGNRRVRDNCSTLLTRVSALEMRDEFSFLCRDLKDSTAVPSTVDSFVNDILGLTLQNNELHKESQIYVLDLSTVEDEVVEVVSSVVTRLIFDRLRRSEKRNTFPVNLILEEAHRYIPRQISASSTFAATRIFERVAKEGRKYGMFIMLSSQRPSELSGTVLSQCSNYVVHRIQNPEDLQHIRRMTPFISESVLNRLASLPKQFALIFGTSVSIPTTFKVRTASPLPMSDDSDVSSYWYRHPEDLRRISM